MLSCCSGLRTSISIGLEPNIGVAEGANVFVEVMFPSTLSSEQKRITHSVIQSVDHRAIGNDVLTELSGLSVPDAWMGLLRWCSMEIKNQTGLHPQIVRFLIQDGREFSLRNNAN